MLKDKPENLTEDALELDLGALENVTGGTGSDGENAGTDGTVVAALDNAMFSVDIGGQTVNVHISGKLRMNYIRLLPGDRVRVEGNRITYRYK
ncbi:MAG: translation initiation factor IF-1 [Clostridia bacterium]|nr:translation initiation factor IF-1 [Clostridia bacterium]